MIKAFISYKTIDKRKREIAHDVFKSYGIEPIVVDSRNEPYEDFSIKIERAMDESDVIVPILTRESISNQWVNQEIGYARRLFSEKKLEILPIAEDNIVEQLNGFIHKHRELYIFKGNPGDLRSENKSFKVQCLRLAEHLISKKLMLKGKSDIEVTFSHLSVRGFVGSDALQLNSSITLENTSNKNISIKAIQIPFSSLTSSFGELSYPGVDDIFFISDFVIDSGKTISVKTNPILLAPLEMKSYQKLIFTGNKPFPIDYKFDLRDKLVKDFNAKNITSLNAKIILLSGKVFELEVRIV